MTPWLLIFFIFPSTSSNTIIDLLLNHFSSTPTNPLTLFFDFFAIILRVMSDMELDVAQSSLFAESLDVNQSSLFADDLDVNQSSLFSETPASKDHNSLNDEYTGPATVPHKVAKLANGTKITLKPKVKSTAPPPAYESNFIDMDKLFSQIELKNSLKSASDAPKLPSTSEVWASKYKPSRFVDLCSAGNDRLYRQVLHWLKKWTQPKESREGDERTFSQPRKVLLVHGPPGTGKTASVHLIARQLGFHVEELNAANSLDSAPDGSGVKLRIVNALTANTVMSKGRPTCLVIDEVDCLANLAEVVRVLNGLQHKKSKVGMNRPIICIANDIYSTNARGFGVSPMEKLRSMSEIVAYRRPGKGKGNAVRTVKEHLMMIGRKEGVDLEYLYISEVVELCDGDIRACLNHLQFARAEEHKSTMDTQISWFQMVDMLFRRSPQLRKENNFMQLVDLVTNGSGRATSSSTLSFDKVVKGCFNRYLDAVQVQDDSLSKPSELADWLAFYDQCSRDDNLQYQSVVGLKIWSLFSEIHPERQKPGQLVPNAKNLEYEASEAMKQNRAVIKRVIDGLPISTKLAIGNLHDTYCTYFLPYLARLFDVDVLSKIKSNLKDHEKKVVEILTSLVAELHLTLENERDLESGQVTLQFEPNWDTIVNFTTEFATSTEKQTQARRQALFPLITSEAERLTMANATERAIKAVVQEPLRKKLKVTSVDFFKGQYDGMVTQAVNVDTSEVQRIWVKYHEGFSAAVRKNIGWEDLWK